ncbi:ester cyclase [Pseudarthrobacter sp. YS3]|uniref:ester cyclase n=1 Tax=Pseudarthrobacter sp. YS3 TaxID=3453718 RepID=UPI003EEEDFCC
MGQAREVMDRFTESMDTQDRDALARAYADEAVLITPDEGQITGRDKITNYLYHFWEAFPDIRYEYTAKYDAGDVAVDEGYVVATNTGPIRLPSGETLPPTGKKVRVRSCDIAQVEAGQIKSHHFYFDQLDYMAQLGLLPESLTRQLSSH